jgi:hypothetical protein
MTRYATILCHCVCVAVVAVCQAHDVPTPATWLGMEPTEDGATVGGRDVRRYVETVASASPRALVETIGLSTDGRPLSCVLVSSATNLASLDGQPPDLPVLLVTCGIHSDEPAATLASMPLLHRLVTGESPAMVAIRERSIVCLVPCVNPDGQERVSRWLRRRAPTERSVPFLYHRYTGHDLNRDWLLGTQAEVRAVITRIHNRLRPWITVDLHQMGGQGPRLFLPPYADPADPAVSETLLSLTEHVGSRVAASLREEGLTGIVTNWRYDAWSPARAYPFYHGGMRLLLEVAGGNFERSIQLDAASLRIFDGNNAPHQSHPAPWSGGRWGNAEILSYFLGASEGVLRLACGDRSREVQQAYQRESGAARFSVILEASDADPALVAELLSSLELTGCEILRHAATGRWIVRDPQWGEGWCRSLLLCTPYPRAGRGSHDARKWTVHRPYDTSSHDLAHLAGVDATPHPGGRLGGEVLVGRSPEKFIVPGKFVAPTTANLASSWLVRPRSSAFYRELADLVEVGSKIERLSSSWQSAEGEPPLKGKPGDFLLHGVPRAWASRLAATGSDALALAAKPSPPVPTASFSYPEITVLQGPGPARDEGWLRWFLEDLHFRFRIVTPRDLDPPPVGTSERHVLLVAEGMSLGRVPGLGTRLRRYVHAGGRVITLGRASSACRGAAELPLPRWIANLPGTALGTRAHRQADGASDPILWGYSRTPNVFYTGGPTWRLGPAEIRSAERAGIHVETVLSLDLEGSPPCGWVPGPGPQGSAAVLRLREGVRGGEWILFGFRPHFRAWTKDSFRLLINAILAP